MEISSNHVARLRALLEQRPEDFHRYSEGLYDENASRQWGALLTAALADLAHRRFGTSPRGDEIITWVGNLRAHSGLDPVELDPTMAEGLIRGLLGEASAMEAIADRIEPKSQTILLLALFEDLQVGGLTVDDVLRTAKTYGDQVLASMP